MGDLTTSPWTSNGQAKLTFAGNMYDGTGFHVDKRQAKHDTIIQKQSCSKFAPFHKMALFAKVFLQFPEAHDVFTIQMRIRITGEGYETANKVSNQFSIPPRSQYDAEWFEVGARRSPFDIPGIETMSDEEISNLECAFFIEPNNAPDFVAFNVDQVYLTEESLVQKLLPFTVC